ncbi:MAG: MGMT family protein [Candidatus Berkelbacteria bacterium]|nr:MGMT family protein [Candidatus Berkelbacteria bacterium]
MVFKDRVINIVKKIHRGKIVTYKQVAILCGRPKAYRAVGNILNKNFSKDHKIPCHRVVKSNGEIGDYALGKKRKEELLKKEGIEIKKHFVDLKSLT